MQNLDLLLQELAPRDDSEWKAPTAREPPDGRAVGEVELLDALGIGLGQRALLQQGIPQEQAKEIVKILKSSGLKVQASIQADQVRVKGKNKDDLQGAIKVLRDSALNFDMQFTNYR